MSKTKEYNPFSNELIELIKGVYSENYEFANRSFRLLIDYFSMGLATDKEIDFLVVDNNNDIVKLLSQLNKESQAYKLLRSTMGKVVGDAVNQVKGDVELITYEEYYTDTAGETFQFNEEV